MNELSDNCKSDLDCAVCLQKCNHPTQLPCTHIFCFLCVKGIAFQSKKCAMCRAVIPPNYLDNPILLGTLSDEQGNANLTQEVYQWFYEGRNGWWKYDERSNSELEAAFSSGEANCTLLLAGTLYNIDFQSMTQVRRSDQTRRRRVRRDTPMFPAKGIAGIKTDDTTTQQTKSDDEDDVIHVQTENEVIEISDDENEILIEPVSEPHEHVNNLIDSIRKMQRLLMSAMKTFSSLRSLPTHSVRSSILYSPQWFAQEQLLQPASPMLNLSCSFKVKGQVRRRCKSCYFVVRDERLYVICPKSPRHKQMAMKPKPLNTWILTHASQSPVRPW